MADIWMDVDTAVTIPVNKVPIVASSDGFTTDETIAWNESGMDLNWNFVTTAGVQTQTNVSPTTAGEYDWTHVGNAMYKIEMTASGGASADNDTEGFGWFSGNADAICPFAGPIIGFRAAALNNALIDGGDLLDVNATQISGDSTAADNLEAVLDGNGITADVDLTARSLTLTHDAGVGLAVTGTTDAITATGTAGSGIKAISSGSNGHGLELAGNGSGEGLSATGGTTGEGIEAIGGASGGAGIRAAATANNDAGMELVKHGTGKDLDADDLADVTTARMGTLTDWINGGRLDLLLDAIKVVTDALTSAGATKLALAATTMITGTVSYDNTNATTTVIYSDDIDEATADHYNGRLFVPTSGVLVGQYTDITDYALVATEGKFTVTAMTEAPADDTTFVIL